MADPGDVFVSAVASDLGRYARVRFREDVELASFGSFASFGSVEDLDAALRIAVDLALDEPDRTAAAVLLLDGDHRWTNIEERYRLAGRAVDRSASWVIRRYRGQRPLNRWFTSVARQLTDSAEVVEAAPVSHTLSGPDTPSAVQDLSARPSARRAWYAPAAVIVVGACAGALAVAQVNDDVVTRGAVADVATTLVSATSEVEGDLTPAASNSTRSVVLREPDQCAVAFGVPSPELGGAQLDRLSAASLEVSAQIGPDECSTRPVEAFGEALVFEVVNADEQMSVVVSPPMGSAVRLGEIQWQSYREIAGRQRPENAVEFGGYPQAVSTLGDGVQLIELSGGGLLIGARVDLPHFWIPSLGSARETWEGAGGIGGGFGLPTSNPYPVEDGVWRQDFEGGFGLSDDFSASPDLIAVQDPIGDLESYEPVEGRVLRQVGGQAWYVDEQRVLHWIRDGETWSCLDASSLVIDADIPGYTIAALGAGRNAECESP